MVKVILFQLFSKQQVLSSELEPVDTAVVAEDVFLVATKEGSVQAYSASEECVLMHQFFIAGAAVLSVEYIPHIDGILTLERNTDKAGTVVVRAYLNWRQGASVSAPALRPLQQEEGMVDGDLDEYSGPFDPDKHAKAVWYYRFTNVVNATAVSVCSVTGNIAISLGNVIRVYVPKLNTQSASSPFICLLEVDSFFAVSMLSLCLDTLAYASTQEMQVIRIDLKQDAARANGQMQLQTAATMLRESFSGAGQVADFDADRPPTLEPVDDTYLVECSFDQNGALMAGQTHMAMLLPSIPVTPVVKQTYNANARNNSTLQVIGPLHWSDSTVRLVPIVPSPIVSALPPKPRGGPSENPSSEDFEKSNQSINQATDYPPWLEHLFIAEVTLILHRRLGFANPLKKVVIRPEKRSKKPNSVRLPHPGDLPMTSPSPLMRGCDKVSRLHLFCSDAQQGLLYDVVSAKLLSKYNYTGLAIDFTLCNLFLYVVTQSGLETWTLRSSLTGDVQSDPLLADIDFPETCLIGFQQFLSLKAIVASDSFLVILSKHFFEKPSSIAVPKRSGGKRISKAPLEIDGFIAVTPISPPSGSWSSTTNFFSSSPSRSHSFSKLASNQGFRGLTSLTSLVMGEDKDMASDTSSQSPSAFMPPAADLASSSSWALYVLSPIPLLSLCDEIARAAGTHHHSNPAVQYLLLLESFFLLQTKLLILETQTDSDEPLESTVTTPSVSSSPSWKSAFRGTNRRIAGSPVLTTASVIADDPVKAMAMTLEVNNVKRLLSTAAAAIAEMFLQQNQYDQAARFFVLANKSLRDVVHLLDVPVSSAAMAAAADAELGRLGESSVPNAIPPALGRQASDNADAIPRARGLLAYLERVLFDPSHADTLDEDVYVANRILQFYYDYQEYRLCDVILDSSLDEYDEKLAVQLLEGLRKQRIMAQSLSGRVQPAVSLYSRPQEAFALALLYLDLGKANMARQRLLEIDRGDLVALTVSYGHLLSPKRPPPPTSIPTPVVHTNVTDLHALEIVGSPSSVHEMMFPSDSPLASAPILSPSRAPSLKPSRLLSLGQLLRLAMPSVLLDALRRIGSNLPIQTSVALLKFKTDEYKDLRTGDDVNEELALLKPYLESLLHDSTASFSPEDHQFVLWELVDIYILAITRAALPVPSSSSSIASSSGGTSTPNGPTLPAAVPVATASSVTATTLGPVPSPNNVASSSSSSPASPTRPERLFSARAARSLTFSLQSMPSSPSTSVTSPQSAFFNIGDSIGFKGGWTSYRPSWIDLVCNEAKGDQGPASTSSSLTALIETTPTQSLSPAWFLIMQLQGLIAHFVGSPQARSKHESSIEQVAEGIVQRCQAMSLNGLNAHDRIGITTILLMCLPAASRLQEAAELILSIPNISVEALVAYAKSTCQQLSEWQLLLDALLKLREFTAKDDRRLRLICRETYSALLEHLSNIIDPPDLLNLLPENGTLAFFLPIVEASLHRYAATSVRESMKAEAARVAAAEVKDT